MNRSNKFFILGLLLTSLQLHASSEARKREAAKIAEHIKQSDQLYKTLSVLQTFTKTTLKASIMPAQMAMGGPIPGFWPSTRAENLKILNDVQYKRCVACTKITCYMGYNAAALYACGFPQAEPCAAATCLFAAAGYISTGCPCTADKDNY